MSPHSNLPLTNRRLHVKQTSSGSFASFDSFMASPVITVFLSIAFTIALSASLILSYTISTLPASNVVAPCRNENNLTPQFSDQQSLELAEATMKKNLLRQSEAKSKIDCHGGGNQYSCGLFLLHMTYLIPPYPCPREVHLATWGEGGKWVCDIPGAIPRGSGMVYSVGSNGETDFEQAVNEEFGVKSFTFDPTLKPNQVNALRSIPFIEFHEIGLAGPEQMEGERLKLQKTGKLAQNAQIMTINGLMSYLNHSFVHVFKMDCEGCERGFLDSLLRVSSRKKPLFGQILIEFHGLKGFEPSKAMFSALESLGYILFHAEANFYVPNECWEAAYIHESVIASSKS